MFFYELWFDIHICSSYLQQTVMYLSLSKHYTLNFLGMQHLLKISEVTRSCSACAFYVYWYLKCWHDKLLNIFIWINSLGLTSKIKYFFTLKLLHTCLDFLGRFWRHSVCTKYLWYNPFKSCLFNLNCKVKC